MVTSTFAEFEVAAYGELAKPPPLRKCWSGGVSAEEAPSVFPDFYRIFYRMDQHPTRPSGIGDGRAARKFKPQWARLGGPDAGAVVSSSLW
jgi:hypothetical protein